MSALNQDYNDRIKNAKTKQQKDAVKKEYEENGFEIKDKFVVAKDASKVKQSLLDWLNIRDRMEKKCNGKIKIGDIKNNESALKSLPKKFNDKAVKALVLIRKIRYYVWFGVIGVFVVVVPALIAFCISSRGTKAEIEKALGKEPKAKEEKNADAEKTEA